MYIYMCISASQQRTRFTFRVKKNTPITLPKFNMGPKS